MIALLAHAEDEAGGLMSPRFARIRPDMHVDEAIRYLQRQVALGEVRLRDWWRIVQRELVAGVTLGLILAGLGVLRSAELCEVALGGPWSA